LGYVFGVDKKLHLDVIGTTRRGDRTALGSRSAGRGSAT